MRKTTETIVSLMAVGGVILCVAVWELEGVALGLAVLGIAGVVRCLGTKAEPVRRKLLRCAGVLPVLLGLYGMAAVLLCLTGAYIVPAAWEWPLAPATRALPLPGGEWAVGLEGPGRVQVYDRDKHYVAGWFVPAGHGAFDLGRAAGGNIQVRTARSRYSLIYTPAGEEVSRHTYDVPPALGERPVPVRGFASAWYLWPLAHPAIGILTFALGGLGMMAWQALWKRAGGGKEGDPLPPE